MASHHQPHLTLVTTHRSVSLPDEWRSEHLAMPQAARAATPSGPSLLRVSGIAGISIAVFCAVYFGLQLIRAVLS